MELELAITNIHTLYYIFYTDTASIQHGHVTDSATTTNKQYKPARLLLVACPDEFTAMNGNLKQIMGKTDFYCPMIPGCGVSIPWDC